MRRDKVKAFLFWADKGQIISDGVGDERQAHSERDNF
jgi:hypothetical protein